jgi:hypothetical protein
MILKSEGKEMLNSCFSAPSWEVTFLFQQFHEEKLWKLTINELIPQSS